MVEMELLKNKKNDMALKIAHSIEFRYDEVKEFIDLNNESPTFGQKLFDYIEYDVLDEEGTVLETWTWDISEVREPSLELILDRTGIKFGLSAWEVS